MGARRKPTPKKQTKRKEEESSEEGEGEVDYAATADFLATTSDVLVDGDDANANDEASDEEMPEADDGDSDDESVEEQEVLEESHDDGDENEVEDDEDDVRRTIAAAGGESDEPCTFDLRNLLGVSSHPIDVASLYDSKQQQLPPPPPNNVCANAATIPASFYTVNEDYLLKKAEAGCNQIIAALWLLPIERSDAGPMVQLPSFDDSKIPRALVRTCGAHALNLFVLQWYSL